MTGNADQLFFFFEHVAVTVLTVLSGAVLVPYQLSEIERVRELSQKTDAKREFEMIQQQTIASANKGTSLEGGDGPSDIDSSSVFIAVNDANIEVSAYVATRVLKKDLVNCKAKTNSLLDVVQEMLSEGASTRCEILSQLWCPNFQTAF